MEDFKLDGFQIVHTVEKDNGGSILREKRVVLGLTQKQVAEKAIFVLHPFSLPAASSKLLG